MISPLFPGKDDEDPPDIGSVHVTRWENGQQIWCPKSFAPEELENHEALHALFGGGIYVLQARDVNNRGWIAQSRVTLPGPPRPLDGSPPPPPAAPAPVVMASSSPNDTMMGFLMQMMLENSKQNAAAQLEASKQNTQMMLMMMQRADSQQAANLAMVREMSEASNRAMERLSEARHAPAAGGNSADLKEGIDLGMSIAQAAAGGGQGGGLEDTIVAAAASFMQGQGAGGGAPGMPPGMLPQ